MFEVDFYTVSLIVVLSYTVMGYAPLFGVKLNYGRLSSSFTSILISPRIAWFVFEAPNLIWAVYFLTQDRCSPAYAMFILHYINRDVIYPLRMKSTTKMPLEIMLSALSFTFCNGYIQGIDNKYSQGKVSLLGVGLFAIGMVINVYSDAILQRVKEDNLKKISSGKGEKQKRYVRVDEFLFKYVSNPNYFGQVIQWIGYAIVSAQIGGWLFAFSTLNILSVGAVMRNKWNKENIQHYPRERKAIIPYVL